MADYSSITNQDRNNIRSDPSRMNNLARLRPEKFDDMAMKEQISIIQNACGDVDPEIIALVFHECDYNMQQTIDRIRRGEFENGGWQTAKSTNKKKSHQNNPGDYVSNNNGILSDSERSLSQRTSPTSSLRSEHRRNDQRRGNQYNNRSSTNKIIPSTTNLTASQSNPSEMSLPSKRSNEQISQTISSSINEYAFVDSQKQSLNFDTNNNNSQKKVPSQSSSSSKHRIRSTVPQGPVIMHPTVQYTPKPIDIQFGDIQWNDSIPRAVTPSSEDTPVSTMLDQTEEDLSTIENTPNQNIQDTTNQLIETTSDTIISNNLPILTTSPEGTSHLSDHLTNTSSSSIPTQYPSQQQIPIPITRLPPTSTPRAPEYTSPTSQFLPTNNLQQNLNPIPSSTFPSFQPINNYPSTIGWNPQTSNYKPNSKTPIIPTGTYQQQPSYQLSHQQQPFLFGTYPYTTLSPTVVQFITPIDPWSTAGYTTPLDTYSYPTTNYIPTYTNQQQYHQPTKYDHHGYDKEYFNNYGQTRSTNKDISYQQQQQSSTPTQSTKDTHVTSKLSPAAATFTQGAPLTTSPSATALYLNPLTLPMSNYYPSMPTTTHHDRNFPYSSMDNRDNRNGASYSGTSNRTNYYY